MLNLDIDSACGQPAWWRARSTSIDYGLEEIRWIHVLRGKSLPAACYGILPNLRKNLLFTIRGGWRIFLIYFVHTTANYVFIILYARPAPASRRRSLCVFARIYCARTDASKRPDQLLLLWSGAAKRCAGCAELRVGSKSPSQL